LYNNFEYRYDGRPEGQHAGGSRRWVTQVGIGREVERRDGGLNAGYERSDGRMKTTIIVRPDEGDPTCPMCNAKLDAATHLPGKAVPKPGDVSVCAGCGELLQFTDRMGLEKMEQEKLAQLSKQDRLVLERASQYFKGKKGN
jgi:hypothetical protein